MSASFLGSANFDSAAFSGPAWFMSAIFRGDAWFGSATFQTDARFESAVFEQEVSLGPLVCWAAEAFGGGLRWPGDTIDCRAPVGVPAHPLVIDRLAAVALRHRGLRSRGLRVSPHYRRPGRGVHPA
ncbi:pentapeptide repeat-containing protein [Streptomyces zhihengii]